MPTFEEIQEEIASMLNIPDEELSEEQRQAMDEYLDMLGQQESAKIDAFAQFLRIQTDLADACKKEGKRLEAKARTAEARIGWLKNKYLTVMQTSGLKKISGSAYTLSIRESEAVVVPEKLDDLRGTVYVREETSLKADKAVIKESLKGGIEVPGCSIQKNYSLQIR